MRDRQTVYNYQTIELHNTSEDALPTISVIIPTFNEERNLPRCLDSLLTQNYPKNKLEIIVVDDNSTDETVEIARQFNARILENGLRNCERGKSIGLDGASGELVLFLDADNYLSTPDCLQNMVRPFSECEKLVGAQPAYYLYRKTDSIPNRYMALIGTNDPLAFYLRRSDKLKSTAQRWTLLGCLIGEGYNYSIIKFFASDLPTVGANGWLTRRDLLSTTHHHPFYFHIDSIYELIQMNHDIYAIVYTTIGHNHARSFQIFVKKLIRNAQLYFRIYKPIRKYKWYISRRRSPYALLAMVSLIIPLLDATAGYRKIKDKAWFLHPLACLCVLIGYVSVWMQYMLSHFLRRLKETWKKT